MNEQFDDMFISLPRSQVEGVAALIIDDVGQGLVSQQRLHHLAVKCSQKVPQVRTTLINTQDSTINQQRHLPRGTTACEDRAPLLAPRPP